MRISIKSTSTTMVDKNGSASELQTEAEDVGTQLLLNDSNVLKELIEAHTDHHARLWETNSDGPSDLENEMYRFRNEWDQVGYDMDPNSPGRLVFMQTARTGRQAGKTRTAIAIEAIEELIHRIDHLEDKLKHYTPQPQENDPNDPL